MSQPDKPERPEVERPTEWPATVNTPYGVQEDISEREYIDLERQGLVRPSDAASNVTVDVQTGQRSATTTRASGRAQTSDSKEN